MAYGLLLNRHVPILLTIGIGFAASCAVMDEQAAHDGGACVGLSCGPTDAGRDQFHFDVKAPDVSDDGLAPKMNPLCGSAGSCMPGDPNACGASPGGAGGTGGSETGGGAGIGANTSFVDASLDSGAPGAGEPAGDDAEPPTYPDAPPGTPPALGCNVTSGGSGHPTAECTIAGTGGIAAPCVSNADCAPGLACVASGGAAQCRPYCCGDPSECEKGTFCAERPLYDTLQLEQPLSIPVCMPADGCNLNEPYPCPATKDCVCKDGTACAVVKDDGTTSCVKPGDGQAGDPCPCAWGYVCSQSTQTCLKICSTGTSVPDCGSGKCQSVSYLPEGYGVCGLSM
jgi:hypothetical protein